MNRLQPAKRSKHGSSLAPPDWTDGKRQATLEQIEQFVSSNTDMNVAVGKKVLKVLMNQVVDLQKTSCISRAKVGLFLVD